MDKHRKALLYRLTYLESACFDMLMAIAEVRHDFRELIERECFTAEENRKQTESKTPPKPAEINGFGEAAAEGLDP